MSSIRERIDEFLGRHRIALVGVSRNPKDFSRTLMHELRQRGYDVVPVNPSMAEVEGLTCFKNVQDIRPIVDGALLMTTPEVTEQVVRDCAAAGIKHVWMQRGEGIGSVSAQAVAFCEEHGISVVPGFCPYMFLPNTPFVHGVHGFIKKLTGSYPS